MSNTLWMMLLCSISALLGIAAAEDYSVDISSNETVGSYLVDGDGFALYYFANDLPGAGTSSCFGDCADAWPPFYTEIITVPSSLRASDFTTITRDDGKLQNVFKGWPLYRYSGDIEAGDLRGQGINDVWFVVSPASIPLS